jgi:hypothetical protein
MRPDLSGVIVVMDRVVWREQKVIVGIPSGKQIPEKSLQYLLGLSKITGMNLLTVSYTMTEDNRFTGTSKISAFGEPQFVDDMRIRFKDGSLNW